MSVAPVRREAVRILAAVAEGRPLDRELDHGRRRCRPRDRDLLSGLVRGTLQWQGRYDHVIGRFSRRRPPRDRALLAILRLALHQLLALDGVPAYAAVHQAGDLCRAIVGDRQVGFVNGVLQAVVREVLGQETDLPPRDRSVRLRPLFDDLQPGSVPWMAAWFSHPSWLVARWEQMHGSDGTRRICEANNRPVPLVFHVCAPSSRDDVVGLMNDAGFEVSPGAGTRDLVAATLSRARVREVLSAWPCLIVQDAAIQEATAWLSGDVATLPPGPVLDMCAAPGGKTAHLSSLWPGAGRFVAMDRRPDRVNLLLDTLRRTGASRVDVLMADGLAPPLAKASCAAVLLDGPCSGTGVLRRHPEGRWQLRPADPGRYGERLLALAAAAADLVRPGGLLMYATCSLEPEENNRVVDRLLADRDDLVPAPDAEGRSRRTWLPGSSAGDGFFAARLLKRAAKG